MRVHTFWHIIETVRARQGENNRWLRLGLVNHLSKLDIEEVLDFAKIFYGYDARLTTKELLQVCIRLRPEADDADFMALRAWVVFQGGEFFRLAESVPALLAELADLSAFDHELASVPIRAYERVSRCRDFYQHPEIEAIVDGLPFLSLKS